MDNELIIKGLAERLPLFDAKIKSLSDKYHLDFKPEYYFLLEETYGSSFGYIRLKWKELQCSPDFIEDVKEIFNNIIPHPYGHPI